MMREILKQNETAVREAGRQLVEIGAELAGGKIDEALARLAAAQGQYAEWDELDQARVDIEGVIRDREGGGATPDMCSPPVQTNTPHNRPTSTIGVAPRNRQCGSHLAVQHILADLVGTVPGAALRSRLP